MDSMAKNAIDAASRGTLILFDAAIARPSSLGAGCEAHRTPSM